MAPGHGGVVDGEGVVGAATDRPRAIDLDMSDLGRLTGSLTSGEDYPSVEGLSLYRLARSLKGELGQAIGIWEKTLDSVLVTNALGSLTKAYFYCPF